MSSNNEPEKNILDGGGNIDTKAAREKNIVVTNTPNVLTEATAEIAMLLILGASRRATEGSRAAENKNWKCHCIARERAARGV